MRLGVFHSQALVTLVVGLFGDRNPVARLKVRHHIVRVVLRVKREGLGRDNFTGYRHLERLTRIIALDLTIYSICRAFDRTVGGHRCRILLGLGALV